MTIIEAGGAQYGTEPPPPLPTTGKKPLPPGYSPETACWLANGKVLITASSPEALQEFLSRMSLLNGKPVSELSALDIYRFCSLKSVETSTKTTDQDVFTEIHLTDAQEQASSEFNRNEYFLDKVPSFPPGSGLYLSSQFDTSWTGLAKDLGLAGLAGAAQALYKGNYGTGDAPEAVDPAALNPETKKLLDYLFGPNTTFNKGHLNILKMMGLVQGQATAEPSTWVLTPKGSAILGAIGTDSVKFIPGMSLLKFPADLRIVAGGVAAYFNGDAYATGFSATDVEKAAETIIGGLPPDAASIPNNLSIPPETVGKMLNHLFGLSAGNTQFTAAQINTAIAMGLIQYNPSSNSLTITNIGQTYLNSKGTAAPAPTAPTPPPPAADPPPPPAEDPPPEEDPGSYWYGDS